MTQYSDIIEEIISRGSERKEPSLESTRKALKALNNPEESYETVLVGGTNGKGSTSEMISKLLQAQSLKVGKYTSPHLLTPRERITVNDQMIDKQEFLEVYKGINDVDPDLTFFEFMTVAAYTYFSQKDVDYAIMEVGMGGRLDATNAVNNKAAVITNVELDHTEYLGDTREEIAREKAGIIPQNGVLITDSDLQPIKEIAAERNTRIVQPVDIDYNNGTYHFEGQNFTLPLKGKFQLENLANALSLVNKIERIPKNLDKSLRNLKCEGRMEVISEDPLYIHDGAHNPAAMEKTIEDLPDNFICVFNATRTKDIESMIRILERQASKFILSEGGAEWSEKPENIEKLTSIPTEIIKDPSKAVETARKNRKPVVVTGSLYLLGRIKSAQK